MKRNDKIFALLASLFVLIGGIIAVTFDGVGGSTDSISHYLISRYAFRHPELFFDHWGKPFFVLLSAPFAQMGMVGMKFFNLLCASFMLCCTYRLAEHFRFRASWMIALIIPFTPFFTPLIFSGLTEILFAAILSWCILLAVRRRYLLSAIFVSFLPFVRSEGLLIIGVFFLYFLIRQKKNYIPYLSLGHLIYAVLGAAFYGGDVFWVFTQIPYAKSDSVYGKGEWSHYIDGLFPALGPVLYILLILGVLYAFYLMFKHRSSRDYDLLILGNFLFFLLAQSSFWALGIFNSMGLMRVFVAVLPLIALLVMSGVMGIQYRLGKKMEVYVYLGLSLLIVWLPFSGHPSSWELEDFTFPEKQVLDAVTAKVLEIQDSDSKIYYYDPKVVYSLRLDPWNHKQTEGLILGDMADIKPNDILIWDDWFGPLEGGLSESSLKSKFRNVDIYSFDLNNESPRYLVIKM